MTTIHDIPNFMFLDHYSKEFIKYVLDFCEYNGITVEFVNESSIVLDSEGEMESDGYFYVDDYGYSELLVAIKRPIEEWLPVLVHEFSHAVQWIYYCYDFEYTWDITNLDFDGYPVDANYLLSCWIHGIVELEPEVLDQVIYSIREFERDCEEKLNSLVDAWRLPISLYYYNQKANANLFAYNYMKETRQWCNSENHPSENETILKNMPVEIDIDHDDSQYNYVIDLYCKEKV